MAHPYDAKLFGDDFLDDILDWVNGNLEPEEVFEVSTLEEWAKEWAENNGYVEEA